MLAVLQLLLLSAQAMSSGCPPGQAMVEKTWTSGGGRKLKYKVCVPLSSEDPGFEGCPPDDGTGQYVPVRKSKDTLMGRREYIECEWRPRKQHPGMRGVGAMDSGVGAMATRESGGANKPHCIPPARMISMSSPFGGRTYKCVCPTGFTMTTASSPASPWGGVNVSHGCQRNPGGSGAGSGKYTPIPEMPGMCMWEYMGSMGVPHKRIKRCPDSLKGVGAMDDGTGAMDEGSSGGGHVATISGTLTKLPVQGWCHWRTHDSISEMRCPQNNGPSTAQGVGAMEDLSDIDFDTWGEPGRSCTLDGEQLQDGATSAKMQWKWSSRKGGMCKVTEHKCNDGNLTSDPKITRGSQSECRQRFNALRDSWSQPDWMGTGVGAMDLASEFDDWDKPGMSCTLPSGESLQDGASSANMQWKWSSRKGGLCKVTEHNCENGNLQSDPKVTKGSQSECRRRFRELQDSWESQDPWGAVDWMDSGAGGMQNRGVGAMDDEWDNWGQPGRSCTLPSGESLQDGGSSAKMEWKWSSRKGGLCRITEHNCEDGNLQSTPKVTKGSQSECRRRFRDVSDKWATEDPWNPWGDEPEWMDAGAGEMTDSGVGAMRGGRGVGAMDDDWGWGDDDDFGGGEGCFNGKQWMDSGSSWAKMKWSSVGGGRCKIMEYTCDDGEIDEDEDISRGSHSACRQRFQMRTHSWDGRRLEIEDAPQLKPLDVTHA